MNADNSLGFISQDGLKAIDADKIEFFVIRPEKNARGKYDLLAKTPKVDGFYEFLILFEHENLEVVKHVMRFLANGKILVPYDAEDKNILVVDLPDLYAHGMKKIAPELTEKRTQGQELKADFHQPKDFTE